MENKKNLNYDDCICTCNNNHVLKDIKTLFLKNDCFVVELPDRFSYYGLTEIASIHSVELFDNNIIEVNIPVVQDDSRGKGYTSITQLLLMFQNLKHTEYPKLNVIYIDEFDGKTLMTEIYQNVRLIDIKRTSTLSYADDNKVLFGLIFKYENYVLK